MVLTERMSLLQPQVAADTTKPPESEIAEIMKNAMNYLLNEQAQIIVIGNQNVGKSTFLNSILNIKLLNTSPSRETAAVWKIKYQKAVAPQQMIGGGAGAAGGRFHLRAVLVDKDLQKRTEEKALGSLEEVMQNV